MPTSIKTTNQVRADAEETDETEDDKCKEEGDISHIAKQRVDV
jgi:hypothetical protein